MKKEDFKFGDPEKYIENDYVYKDKDYILIISKDIFNDETIMYANEIVKKIQEERDNILDCILKKGLRSFYNKYTDEDIKNNIGRPQVRIISKKDSSHPNWKFEYYGAIEFVENKLDEHIIIIEFVDDLNFANDIQIDG